MLLKGKLKDLLESGSVNNFGFSYGYGNGYGYGCGDGYGYGESDIAKAGVEIINEKEERGTDNINLDNNILDLQRN